MKLKKSEMPKACKKGDLYNYLHEWNPRVVSKDINEIMAKQRNLTIDEVKKEHLVLKPEVKELLENYGELEVVKA